MEVECDKLVSNKLYNYYIKFFRNRSMNKDARLYGAVDYLGRKSEAADYMMLNKLAKDAQGGTELSGGQQQKLAIARAIYRSSPLIILDEPTAALDPLAEAEVYDKFKDAIIKDKTAIYISHRLSSCKFCDVVLYIENGGIAEQGSHDALMAHGGQYARLFRLQQEQFAVHRTQ